MAGPASDWAASQLASEGIDPYRQPTGGGCLGCGCLVLFAPFIPAAVLLHLLF